jgi:ppGpp synthetase/RelA/SpoT-type nucleotidyltranferase
MVEKQMEIYNQICDFYEKSVFDSLHKSEIDKMIKVFQDLINRNSKEYFLSSQNSVHQSVYAKVTGRVKSKNSFKEKLIRKNLGLDLIRNLDINFENLNQKKGDIKPYIERNFDDIVGLRVVCDLGQDCLQVFKLLQEKEDDLEKSGILFNLGEMENQPQIMKNGLHIFRIKGVYESRIAFELQIKSKIEEAWGELDHFILYKDFSYFPTKNIVQKTMNNVGKLLDEIEHLLFDLRSSRSEYNDSLEDTKFLDTLEKTINDSIVDNFGFSYQIEQLASVIKLIIDSEDSNFLDEPRQLKFDFLEFKTAEHSDYLMTREGSYELQILESIFAFIWSEKNGELNAANYDQFLTKLKDHLVQNMLNVLRRSDKLDSYSETEVEILRNFLIEVESDSTIWISPKKVSELIEQRKLLSDSLFSLIEKGDHDFLQSIGEIDDLIEEINKLNAMLLFESKKFDQGVDRLSIDRKNIKRILVVIKSYLEEFSLSMYNEKTVKNLRRSVSLLIKKI